MNLKKSLENRTFRKYVENRIRGWLPKETSIPSNQRTKMAKTDMQRKIFRISVVADAIMLNIFFVTHLLIDPSNRNIGFIVISWIIFILSLISVNFLLYRYSKTKANNQMEQLQQ